MLMIIGEYIKELKDDLVQVGGLGFNISQELSKYKVSVAFESLISGDECGIKILDILINSGIIFDPILCNSSYPSACKNINNGSLFFDKSSSSMLLESQIEDSISNNDDVKVIHFGSYSYYSYVSGSSIIKCIKAMEQRPIIVFNSLISYDDIPNIVDYENRTELALKLCDIVIVTDVLLDYMYPQMDDKIGKIMQEYNNISVLYFNKTNISFLSSVEGNLDIKITKIYELNESYSVDKLNIIIASAFLSYLHENNIFGDELSNPSFRPTKKSINNSLDFVIDKLNN